MVGMSVLQEEQRTLRGELTQLKGCQLQYFTLSVTGTAAIFGVVASSSQSEMLWLAFLFPLAIVIPCWFIFFDKATTITRTVGYCQVVEDLIAESSDLDFGYIGYEKALALYREEEDAGGRKTMNNGPAVDGLGDSPQKNDKGGSGPKRPRWWEIRHRYWEINWWTYMALSVLSCLLSEFYVVLGPTDIRWCPAPAGAFILVLLSAYGTRRLMMDVIGGDHSYPKNYRFWRYIHCKHAPKATAAGPGRGPDADAW